MSADVLTVEHLSLAVSSGAARRVVVDDVSFSVAEGETVALVGESGAGKSATALSLLGLLPTPPFAVSGGRAELAGIGDLLSMKRQRLREVRGRDVAMVFQDPLSALNPVISVGDQIEEGLRLHDAGRDRRSRRRRARDLLVSVRIPDATNRMQQYPHEFSGGMRQRAMVAMAIANSPRLIIADEPTTALDATTQAQVLDVMRDRQASTGAALLLITHDLGIVAQLADRVLIMYAGRIVEEAEVHQLFTRPRHPYTRALLNSVPRIDRVGQRLDAIPGSPPSLDDPRTGCSFEPRCPLGHGRQTCRDAVPDLVLQDGDHSGDAQRAACHFADERVDQETEAGRA